MTTEKAAEVLKTLASYDYDAMIKYMSDYSVTVTTALLMGAEMLETGGIKTNGQSGDN